MNTETETDTYKMTMLKKCKKIRESSRKSQWKGREDLYVEGQERKLTFSPGILDSKVSRKMRSKELGNSHIFCTL